MQCLVSCAPNRYAECRYAERHLGGCRGAERITETKNIFLFHFVLN